MMWTKSHNLADLAYMDVQEYLRTQDLVVVPIGSCEKHGAHIPLGTDAFITIGVVAEAARKAGRVVPAVPSWPPWPAASRPCCGAWRRKGRRPPGRPQPGGGAGAP